MWGEIVPLIPYYIRISKLFENISLGAGLQVGGLLKVGFGPLPQVNVALPVSSRFLSAHSTVTNAPSSTGRASSVVRCDGSLKQPEWLLVNSVFESFRYSCG